MAAALGRGVAELVAQHLDQGRAAVDEFGFLLAIQRELDRNLRHVSSLAVIGELSLPPLSQQQPAEMHR